jgi:hypothetical protein
MLRQFKKGLVSLLSLALIALSVAPPLLAAQQPTGSIEGTVTDPQGAIVQNATITAREVATGLTRNTTSGDDGRYRIAQLPPGTYEVKVTGQGFKSSVASNVKVDVGQNVPIDVKLEIGGASETVTVAGGGEVQVDRTDHTVSGVVGRNQIENMPLNGRNFLNLAALAGAQTVDGGSFDPTKANYTGVSIAGQMGRSTQITVDGGSVVDNVVGTTVQNFSQEIVQEFQVGITNFDLSTGASATGSVNVVSRSGSNEFHGNGYSYWRDDRWSAFPALNRLDAIHGIPTEVQRDQIPFDRQQFGGTFSGPIKKDKLFFFGNAEYNNQDSVAIHVLAPTIRGFNGFTPFPFNELLVTGKFDWTLGSKTNMFARFSHNDNDQRQPFAQDTGIVPRDSASGIFQSNDQVNTNRSDGVVVGMTRNFGSNLVNSLLYNFNDFHNRIDPATEGFPEIRVINPDQNWKSGSNYITPQVTDQSRHQIKDDLTWTKGAHTLRFGGDWERTSITGLFEFAKPARIRLYGPFFTGADALETEDDFLDTPVRDLFMGIGSGVLPFNTPEGATVNHRFQFYGTDSWRIHRNFSFNFGLAYRWDSNLWNHDQSRPDIVAGVFGKGTSPSKKDNNNFAPRIGFAWDLSGNGRTVIRGGFGMYYDTTIDNLRLFERADLGPPGSELFLGDSSLQSSLLPGGDGRFAVTPGQPTGFITLRQMLARVASVRADVESRAFNCSLPTSIECFESVSGPLFSTEFQIPYSIQYAIGVQKELPGKMLLQADFNYRKGVHEVIGYDANFFDSVDRNGNPTPITDFPGPIPYADSSAFSVYKALFVRLNRRFSNGFQLTSQYTMSRFENFGGDGLGLGAIISDRTNFRKEFGPGGLDQTHRLGVSVLWELPFYKDSSSFLKKHLLGSWTVALLSSTSTGLPFSAILPDFVDLSGTGSFFSYLPGVEAGRVGRRVNSLGELNSAIRDYNANINSFAARIEGGVPVDPYGTPLRTLAELPPGTYIGSDSLISQDIRLTKSFRFTESKKLDLIGEVFNVFNVANLTGFIDNVIPAQEDAASPGFEFTAFRPTQRQNGIFGTGGPRAFQFALRFTF